MIVHVYSLRRDSLGMRLVAISCCCVVFVCLFVCVYFCCVFFGRCFKVYIDSEFWYAHSVEELVIWTVEREHGTCVRSSLR